MAGQGQAGVAGDEGDFLRGAILHVEPGGICCLFWLQTGQFAVIPGKDPQHLRLRERRMARRGEA